VNATPVTVRIPPDQLAKLDAWITDQGEPMTRPEAVRQILAHKLAVKTTGAIEEALVEHWGSRCAEPEPGCPVCDAWAEFDALA